MTPPVIFLVGGAKTKQGVEELLLENCKEGLEMKVKMMLLTVETEINMTFCYLHSAVFTLKLGDEGDYSKLLWLF